MELASFLASLNEVRELGNLVQVASSDARKLKPIGIGVGVVSTATSGAIVLCVARFEDFLKGAAEQFLGAYARSSPPIPRSLLAPALQVTVMSKNIAAAAQKSRYGVARTPSEMKRNIEQVAARILNDDVWGDDAISTHSNPGPETVAEILRLLGIDNPWRQIEPVFAPLWEDHQAVESSHKAIPSASNELKSILGWRNVCAHSSGTPAIGAKEIWETIAFFEVLSTAIDSVLADASRERIEGLGSVPAVWA